MLLNFLCPVEALTLAEQPAILVAGGGGGAAYPTGQGASIADGQPGGMTFDGRGTTGDGSTGSVMGQGGARGSNADDYTAGGGGGFISPGLPRTTQISSGVSYSAFPTPVHIYT